MRLVPRPASPQLQVPVAQPEVEGVGPQRITWFGHGLRYREAGEEVQAGGMFALKRKRLPGLTDPRLRDAGEPLHRFQRRGSPRRPRRTPRDGCGGRRAPRPRSARPSPWARRASRAAVGGVEGRHARGAEDLEDRHGDRAEGLEGCRRATARPRARGDRVARRRRGAARPDRPGSGPSPASSIPTTSRMKVSRAASGAPRSRWAAESLREAGRLVRHARPARERLRSRSTRRIDGVRSDAPSAHRPPNEWPRTSTGPSGVSGHGLGNGRDVLELALDRVRARCRRMRLALADRWRGGAGAGRAAARRPGTSGGPRWCHGPARAAASRAPPRPIRRPRSACRRRTGRAWPPSAHRPLTLRSLRPPSSRADLRRDLRRRGGSSRIQTAPAPSGEERRQPALVLARPEHPADDRCLRRPVGDGHRQARGVHQPRVERDPLDARGDVRRRRDRLDPGGVVPGRRTPGTPRRGVRPSRSRRG